LKKATVGGRGCWPWWRQALTGLSALGLGLSAYLSWHYLTGGSLLGCGDGSPCDQVLNSRWSSIGGVVPVCGLAAGAYLAMVVAGFYTGPAMESSVRRLAWGALLILSGTAAGSAVWFISIQKWAIGSFCPYCLATHTTSLLLAALVIWQAPKQLDNGSPAASQRLLGGWPATGCAALGLGLAGLLAVCQATINAPLEYHAGQARDNPSLIETRDAPLIGSPDARHLVELLFDYKCPHCQQLHLLLAGAVRRYHGELAVVLCPTPLNTQCNPYIPRDVDEFKDSCELAKTALTVWVAKREAFPDFDRWLFSFESGDRWQPRSLDAARAKAVELVGQAKFDAARTDPWINQYMQTSMRIFGNTTQDGNHAVPKLVYGARWVIPQPNDADELLVILQDSLALPAP
jgi:uncharacterized membrane protein